MSGKYPAICLNGKNAHVHRLEWEKHHGKIPDGYIIHHKDEDKTNNTINNLEWCSYQYNSNYGSNPSLQKERMELFRKNNPNFLIGENNPKSILIKCIETNKIFESFSAAAKWCGLKSTASFTDYFNGEQESAGKHPITKQKLHWEKYENNEWIKPLSYIHK